MKVGDLVKARPCGSLGVVVDKQHRQVQCVWYDGDVSWCLEHYLEVV